MAPRRHGLPIVAGGAVATRVEGNGAAATLPTPVVAIVATAPGRPLLMSHLYWLIWSSFIRDSFAKYSNSEYSTPCILLFVGSKADHKEGAVVISDQKGVTIFRSQLNELFPETTTENDAANGRFWITVGSLQRLEFETEIERCYVMAIWTAVYEYLNHCRRVISPKEAIHALASLATNVYVTLSPAKSWGFSREISTKMTPACALRDAIKRHTRARDWGTLSKKYNPLETSLLTWAGGQSHADIVLALLQYKVDPGCVPTAVGAWMDCTLLTAAGEGNVMMFQVLLNENRRRRLTITAELHQWPVRMHKRHRAFAKYQRWSSPTTANLSYGGPCEWQTRYRNVDVGIRADEDHYGGMEGPSDVLREQDKSWSFAKKKDQELRPLSDMVGMLFVAGRGGSIKVVELVRALLKTDRKRLNDISGISGVEEDSSRVEAMLKHAVVDGNKAGHDDDDTIMTGAVDGDRPEIIRHFLPDYLKTLESQWPKGPSSICHVCEWLGGMYLNVAVVCGRTRAAKALVTTAQSHAQKHDTQSIGELVTEDNVLVFACRIAAGVDIHAVYTDPRGGSDITALEMASRAKSYKIADYLNIIHFQGQRVARDPE
ncbi:hypothetical protein DFH27DRAFT_616545 [Peziza echinospora]|nr:hypothetical protein DFH27DRAFT_616545 [Peziza echinospora]